MKYLAIYYYTKEKTEGFGSRTTYFSHNPPTSRDIRELEEKIAKDISAKRVILINLLPLSEDE